MNSIDDFSTAEAGRVLAEVVRLLGTTELDASGTVVNIMVALVEGIPGDNSDGLNWVSEVATVALQELASSRIVKVIEMIQAHTRPGRFVSHMPSFISDIKLYDRIYVAGVPDEIWEVQQVGECRGHSQLEPPHPNYCVFGKQQTPQWLCGLKVIKADPAAIGG